MRGLIHIRVWFRVERHQVGMARVIYLVRLGCLRQILGSPLDKTSFRTVDGSTFEQTCWVNAVEDQAHRVVLRDRIGAFEITMNQIHYWLANLRRICDSWIVLGIGGCIGTDRPGIPGWVCPSGRAGRLFDSLLRCCCGYGF
jgi:hypothetical protein